MRQSTHRFVARIVNLAVVKVVNFPVDPFQQPLLLLRLGLRLFLGRHIAVLDPRDDRFPQIHILDQRLGLQRGFKVDFPFLRIGIVAIETVILDQG